MHTIYRKKVAQDKIITHIDFLGKTFSVATLNLLLKIQHGLEINVAHINSRYENKRGL